MHASTSIYQRTLTVDIVGITQRKIYQKINFSLTCYDTRCFMLLIHLQGERECSGVFFVWPVSYEHWLCIFLHGGIFWGICFNPLWAVCHGEQRSFILCFRPRAFLCCVFFQWKLYVFALLHSPYAVLECNIKIAIFPTVLLLRDRDIYRRYDNVLCW